MTQKISSIDYEGLISCAKGEMFGKGNPQLPMPPMLMMDRISEISSEGGSEGKGHVIAEYDIRPDLWFFECHFINDPVMPGCLGLDALWQLTGFNLGCIDEIDTFDLKDIVVADGNNHPLDKKK